MNRLKFITIFFVLFYTKLNGQNVFPQKVEGCNLSQFCLDCGEPKAGYNPDAFIQITDSLNTKYNFKGGSGKIGFQLLVDSLGKGCVLSHTDASNSQITKDIIKYLNDCKWNSAIENNKAVNSSINVFFEVLHDKLSGQIQRVDIEEINENMKNPGTPVIYNKTYKYNNNSLKGYEITVWQKENSKLQNDMSTICVIDKNDKVWYATYNGLATFDGKDIVRISEKNSPFKVTEDITAIAVDNDNNKWIYAEKFIYKYDNKNWVKYDSTKIGSEIPEVYAITATPFGEVLFSTAKGLFILKNGAWEILNNRKITELPDSSIYYAYKDEQQRLWIGTFDGSIMIDRNNKVTEFNKSNTPLKNTCISNIAEDEKGNLYFALYAYQNKDRNKLEEGLTILSKNGDWTHYNDSNSGLPSDGINSLLYDKFEKVLWLGTNESGLVRFDLKDQWENYHNQNSKIPSSYVFDLVQDSKGNIYGSTFYGMMRLKKK